MTLSMQRFCELVILLVLLIAQLEINLINCEDPETLWREFKTKYGRNYRSSAVEGARKRAFMSNLERITTLNADSSQGYQLGINQFADQTLEEFLSTHTGLISQSNLDFEVRDAPSGFHQRSASLPTTYPKSLNYQNTGYVSPVKDQKTCGSCWAFAASQAIEGQTFRVLGRMISSSQQQLVDCANSGLWKNNGCNGGNAVKAFVYISNGIMNEAGYPYTSSQGSCKADSSKNAIATNQFLYNSDRSNYIGYYTDNTNSIINFYSYHSVVDSGNGDLNPTFANTLIQVLNNVGPVSIEVCVEGDFQHFVSGVYYNASGCPTKDINHAVLLVGYNISSSDPTQQYWIVKNQWNTKWGLSGYINIRYGAGLIRNPTYPIISNSTAFTTEATKPTTSTTSAKPTVTTTTTTKPTTTTTKLTTTTAKPTTTTTKKSTG